MNPDQPAPTALVDATSLITQIATLPKPKVQLVLSGKRKCGKDYLEQIILERFPGKVLSYRISSPIKGSFARQHGLDYAELLTASQYKEQYRQQMVTWSEAIRQQDPHYFLRLAITEAAAASEQQTATKPIWLLNDARRPADLAYFTKPEEIDMSRTVVLKVRVTSSQETRIARGWQYTEGIDDQQTECGLDGEGHDWDYILVNDGTREQLLEQLEPIFGRIAGLI